MPVPEPPDPEPPAGDAPPLPGVIVCGSAPAGARASAAGWPVQPAAPPRGRTRLAARAGGAATPAPAGTLETNCLSVSCSPTAAPAPSPATATVAAVAMAFGQADTVAGSRTTTTFADQCSAGALC